MSFLRQTVVPAASTVIRTLWRRIAGGLDPTDAPVVRPDPAPAREAAARQSLSQEVYWESDAQGRLTHVGAGPAASVSDLQTRLGRCRWDDGALPLQQPDWQAHREAIARGEPFSEFGWVWTDASGHRHVRVDSGHPVRDASGTVTGWVGLSRDAAPAQAADRARRLASAALLAAHEPVLWIEAPGGTSAGWRIVWANRAALTLFDRSERELRDLPERTLFGPESTDASATIDQHLRAASPLRLRTTLARKHGVLREVDLRLEPLPGQAAGQAAAALLLDDLTQATQAQAREWQAHEAAAADHRARLQQLQATARELDAFAYSVSHDLRAPIRVIEGFARILEEDYGERLDAAGHEHLQRILSGANRMTQMLEALLELSRLSHQSLSPEVVDLSRLADAVVEELRVLEPQRRCHVSVQPGMQARGDRMLLRAVLTNLIGNAWKYTGKTADARISFEVTVQGEERVYCVRDNGAGFDMRHAERLFGVFQRLHRDAEFPGSGVGLATVDRIVRRHGGRIWAESTPGQGSRFCFTLGTEKVGPASLQGGVNPDPDSTA